MPAIDWSQASIHVSRLRSVQRPVKAIEYIPPHRIDPTGLRWLAVRVMPKCEPRVCSDLTDLGYAPYCPLGAKFVFWKNGKNRGLRKTIRQFPVFAGYIFVGLSPGQCLARDTARGVISILGNSAGPLKIPPAAIETINSLEMASHWDATRSWREKSPYQAGKAIRITEGAYAAFQATVDALVSESRIRVLVGMFGREVPIELDTSAVEMA